jgi:nucleoside-diphosphate-sugar epimerase
MRVFVTGGTGEIGRPAVANLVAAGHVVQVASRSNANDGTILSLGATPVRVDLVDPDSARAAVEDAEAIVHLATRIPPVAEMGSAQAWRENDRLRRETTMHLADAARAQGVEVLVLQSYFGVRAPAADEWISDEHSVGRESWSGISVMDSMRDAELAAGSLDGTGTRAVVLRFGSLYSETSEQLQAQVRALLTGTAAVAGPGTNFWPFIASRDAGAAVSHALAIPTGTYHVADDRPVTLKEFWQMAARAVGVAPPGLNRVAEGPMAELLLGSWRLDNGGFCRAARWSPRVPSVLEGWPDAARRVASNTQAATTPRQTNQAAASNAEHSAEAPDHRGGVPQER